MARVEGAIVQNLANLLKRMKKNPLKPLEPFLPSGTLPLIEAMLQHEHYHIVITKPRSSKLGDFRHPRPGEVPKLTVNGNLEPYNFLITLVHEIAHLKTWRKYQNKVKPHGAEWKNCYSDLLSSFFGKNLFPENFEKALLAHAKEPKYSTHSDAELMAVLYSLEKNKVADNLAALNELPLGTVFHLQQKVFRIEEKLRKNYLCSEINTGQKYRINPMARVMVDQEKKEPENQVMLYELPPGTVFYLQNKVFKIEGKLRKNYLCTELKTGQKYHVNAMARVMVAHRNIEQIK